MSKQHSFIQRLAFAIVLIACQLSALASHELGNVRVSGTDLQVGSIINLQDNKWCYVTAGSCTPPLSFYDQSVKNHVTVGVDHYSDLYNNAYDLTFNLKITYKKLTTAHVFGPMTTQTVLTSLNVAYKPLQGTGNYTDKSVYSFEDGYEVIAEVLSVADNNNGGALITTLPTNLFLETDMDAERMYSFDRINTPLTANPFSFSTNASDEIVVSWNHIMGAEAYDLEWTWVSSELNVADGFTYDIDFRNNSNRVRISNQFYTISNIFERGKVFFRVRGVSRCTVDQPYDVDCVTPWTWGDFSSVQSIDDLSAGSTCPQYIDVDIHEKNKNWQYAANYAEEGKKKEVISYFDGSLHNRQSVTRNNSDHTVLVGETYYDYQGRPAIQALPVPTPKGEQNIQFFEYGNNGNYAFNFVAGTNTPFTRSVFDVDASSCAAALAGMDNQYGSSKYYSPNSFYMNMALHQSYVPDAELYPFTQTEYTKDNTGRVARQGGVGPVHQLGTGHESKYFYGSPNSQTELDRIFGSEVGLRKHYKKNMVMDANGQVSITYLDMAGHTIATALAGQNPANLLPLTNDAGTPLFEANATIVRADLLNKQNPEATDTPNDDNELSANGNALVYSNEVLVPENGVYKFHYDVTGTTFTYTCNSQNFCYDCIYDMEIDIVDKCGNNPAGFTKVRKVVGNLQPTQVNENHDEITSLNTACEGEDVKFTLTPDPLNVTLTAGAYTVTKRLLVNKEAMAYYLQQYIENNECIRTEESFINEEKAQVDTSGCNLTCDACVAALGDPAQYRPTQYDSLKAFCMAPCEYQSSCASSYQAMLSDVSPGGQYAEWESGNGVFNAGQYVLSVLNTSNMLKRHTPLGFSTAPTWKNPVTPYVNDNGTLAYVDVVGTVGSYTPALDAGAPVIANGSGLMVQPQYLANGYDFVMKWNSGWAQSLVPYHPEYCYYDWCIKNSDPAYTKPSYSHIPTYTITYNSNNYPISSSEDFDELLLRIEDPTLIAGGGFLQLLDPIGYDPYFNGGRGSHQKTGQVKTNNYPNGFNYYESATTRFNNYQKRTTTTSGSSLDLYHMAYAIASGCAQQYGVTLTNSNPCFPMSGTSLITNGSNAEIRLKWEKFKFLYFAMKQEMQSEAAQNYAVYDCKSCNDCIGNSNSGIFSIPQSLYPYFNPWFDISNWFFGSTQPCGINNNDPDWYAGKVKRFPSTDDALGLSADASGMYAQTGQCPSAVSLQALLNTLAINNQIESSTALSLVPEFNQVLYNAVGGNSAGSFQAFTWNPSVTGGGTTLTANFTGTSTACSVSLNWPGGSPANWNNTGASSTYAITGMNNLSYISTSAGQYSFSVVATVVTGGGAPTNYTLTGTTCIPLTGCSFTAPCPPNSTAVALKQLLNVLAANSALCNTSGLSLASSPYNTYFTNGLGSLLPSAQWYWKYDSPNSRYLIYDNAAVSPVKIVLTPATSALCNSAGSYSVIGVSAIAGDPNGGIHDVILTTQRLTASNTFTTVTVPLSVGMITTASQTTPAPLKLSNCGFGTDCLSAEHEVKADLENFLTQSPFQTLLNSSTSVNLTPNMGFTLPLRAVINPSLTAINSSSPPTITTQTVNYFWTKNTSASTSTLLSVNICAGTSTVAPASGCCLLTLKVQDNTASHVLANILSISSMTVLNTPLTAGESHNFLVTATYTDNTTGILEGFTSCFPLRACEQCEETAPSVSPPYAFETFNSSTPSYSTALTYVAPSPPATLNLGTTCNVMTQYSPVFFGTADLSGYLAYEGTRSAFMNICNSSQPTSIYRSNIGADYMAKSSSDCNGIQFKYFTLTTNPLTFDIYVDGNLVATTTQTAPAITNTPTPVWTNLYLNANIPSTYNGFAYSPLIEIKVRQQGSSGLLSIAIDYLEIVPKLCSPLVPCDDGFHTDPMPQIPYVNPCAIFALKSAEANGKQAYEAYIDSLSNDFTEKYMAKCMGSVVENFTMEYPLNEYQYTLYFYDQAGNLIKTVPPKGVVIETDPTVLATIASDKLTNPAAIHNLGHTMGMDYDYNSLNQSVRQRIPDAGTSLFWYDGIGRIVASQSAKQSLQSMYAYTHYDALGRPTETGELQTTANLLVFTPAQLTATLNAVDFPNNLPGLTKREITHTYFGDDSDYFTFIPTSTFVSGEQEYTRSRIAAVSIESVDDGDPSTYDHATYYNYDVHGNINELIQHNPSLASINDQQYKKLLYTYDLVGGSVLATTYQPGKADQFFQRFVFNADNQLSVVYASKDNVIWDRDAKYFYYLHGPLARMESGDNQVIGTDYAYTLHGWMKGVNSDAQLANLDMGKDAYTGVSPGLSTINGHFSKDPYSYSLHYYKDLSVSDYKPANSLFQPTANNFLSDVSAFYGNVNSSPLYNGNISRMLTSYLNQDPLSAAGINSSVQQLGLYKYDQLNRIRNVQQFKDFNAGSNTWQNTISDTYKEAFTYDLNGNIKTLTRNGNLTGSLAMDQLSYSYISGTNRLDHISDSQGNTGLYSGDIESQAPVNYDYDADGKLIKDLSEDISSIEWRADGKISKVIRLSSSTRPNLSFSYDALGRRVRKAMWTNSNPNRILSTYYVLDMSGNVMAVYNHTIEPTQAQTLVLDSRYIYGNTRIGMFNEHVDLTGGDDIDLTLTSRTLGLKSFEQSNHLGNVITAVSDKKNVVASGSVVSYYLPDVITTKDYYSFGSAMPGRYFSSSDYRYGYQGQENDMEIKGEGNSYDFGARMYDSRAGRWLSVDPRYQLHFDHSPYCFVGNSPFIFIDVNGEYLAPANEYTANKMVEYLESYGLVNDLFVVHKIPGEKGSRRINEMYGTYHSWSAFKNAGQAKLGRRYTRMEKREVKQIYAALRSGNVVAVDIPNENAPKGAPWIGMTDDSKEAQIATAEDALSKAVSTVGDIEKGQVTIPNPNKITTLITLDDSGSDNVVNGIFMAENVMNVPDIHGNQNAQLHISENRGEIYQGIVIAKGMKEAMEVIKKIQPQVLLYSTENNIDEIQSRSSTPIVNEILLR